MGKRDPKPTSTLAAPGALGREILRLRDAEQRLREQNEGLLENQLLLEEARDDYAELYDCAPLALLTLAASGSIRSANLAAAELLECERSTLVGRSFVRLFSELDQQKLKDCLSAPGGLSACRVQLVLPDAALASVQVSRRFSVRKSGVSHVTLVDLRRLAPGAPEPVGSGPTQDKRRILLVEDHHETAEAMQEVLERRGYRVVCADSVQAAVQIDLTGVDAIVSDILLPDGRGTDLLRHLKRTREVPAIAFSGLVRNTDIELAKQAGFDVYLTKPVDFSLLLSTLGRMLGPALNASAPL